MNKFNKLFSAFLIANSGLACAGTMGPITVDEGKRFSVNVAPIYGALRDGGVSDLNYVNSQDNSASGNYSKTYNTSLDSRWGYALGVGYHYGADHKSSVLLNYTNLKNKNDNYASSSSSDVLLYNKLSQINNNSIYNGTAAINTHINYQTLDLLANRAFQSQFVANVEFSRYYGIKATQIKKGFSAWSSGTQPFTTNNLSDQIDYKAQYYGVGPRIGMGAAWSITPYLSLVGDVSSSLLGGSYNSKWNESFVTTNLTTGAVTNQSSYVTNNKTTTWIPLVVSGNIALEAHYDMNAGHVISLSGGVNTEQYISNLSITKIKGQNSNNRVSMSNLFSVNDVFIKLNYLC